MPLGADELFLCPAIRWAAFSLRQEFCLAYFPAFRRIDVALMMCRTRVKSFLRVEAAWNTYFAAD